MTPISEGFTQLTQTFFKMPEVQQAIADMATSMNDFATYLKSDEAQKALSDFVKEVIKTLRTDIEDLKAITHFITTTYDMLFGDKPSGPSGLQGPAQAKDALQAPFKKFDQQVTPNPRGPGTPRNSVVPNMLSPSSRATAAGPVAAPTQSPGSPLSGAAPSPFRFGSGPPVGGPPASGPVVPGGANFPGPPAAAAASRMAPSGGNSIMNLLGGGSPSAPGKQASLGPLDMHNWQQNQKTALIVKGVPSANTFLQANAMG